MRFFKKLQKAIAKIVSDEIKTTSFNVRTEYEHKNMGGNYTNELKGFVCTHRLKLEFGLDMLMLNRVISAIVECGETEFNVVFTVKDKDAVSDALLASATQNARHKAEVLCNASGVKLDNIISIEYSFGDMNLVSSTHMEVRTLSATDFSLTPDDITVSDSVTFVWGII